MKYWFGHPMRECQCGFCTPDEDEFLAHLKKTGHQQKQEPKKEMPKKTAVKKTEAKAAETKEEKKE